MTPGSLTFSLNTEEHLVYTKPEPAPEVAPRKVTPEPTAAEPQMVPSGPKSEKPGSPEPKVAKVKAEPEAVKPKGKVVNK